MRKYSIMMAIRLVCIGLCLVAKGWWLVLPAAGAIILPYVAVIVANNVKPRGRGRVQRPGALVHVTRKPRP